MTLIEAYQRGDDAALTSLVERHQAKMYRLALGALSSPQEAEDATQESLIAMLGSLAGFRGDSAFSTWLYRLTLNTCLKRGRGRVASRTQPLEPAAVAVRDEAPGPEERAGRTWLRERVDGFLGTLSDTYRVPVVLSDALNLGNQEIANVLDISLPAAKARILRGRQQLREEIERYCQDAGLSGWRELVS